MALPLLVEDPGALPLLKEMEWVRAARARKE